MRLRRILGIEPPAAIERFPSIWEALVTAILGGRLAPRNALARSFGTVVRFGGRDYAALPDPKGLARRSPRELVHAGVPALAARRLLAAARRVANGSLNLGALFGKPRAEVFATLATIEGLHPRARAFVATRSVGSLTSSASRGRGARA